MVQFSEDFLSWTLLQTTTGLWSYDIENNLMSWNEAVFQIHGLDQDFEPSLNAMTELFIAEYQEFLKTSIDNAIELGKPWDLELKIQTPSGVTKWLHSIGRAIREDDKTIRLES
ncbi:MAG: PAS domain-containing protein, partial [Bacteriovoracaceae bacterium]|nr:PAS domain-containing protein [Bacteriovoracaceae bacterium]